MLYLLAILVPPIAVLMVGKPMQALINLCLCLLLYVPACIHAFMVVHEHKANERARKYGNYTK